MSVTRRSFIALGAGALLSACGGSSDETSGAGTGTAPPGPASTGAGGAGASGFTTVARFPNTSLTPGRVRLPLSIADASGTLQTTGPDALTGRIRDQDGTELSTFSASVHSIGEGAPLYWSVSTTLDAPGIYVLEVDGEVGMPTAFQLFDPSEIGVPSPGTALPAFDTPTVDDARGVDPLCTLTPDPCPFHTVTLTDALASGLPVVYLIGTPAFCATGTCAPGLEFLVEVASAYEDRAVFVHAEVYADNAGTIVAPAVTAVGTDYEPLLFITDAAGMVTERLDVIWDAADLADALERNLG